MEKEKEVLTKAKGKKGWEVVYTADELRRIGGSLALGDAHKIVEAVGVNYHTVKIVLSGNREAGITNKSKVGMRVVKEALRLIDCYAKELEGKIRRLQVQKHDYLELLRDMRRASA
jgi:hypothetical protein